MKDDRLRQPIRADYAEALGHAIYCFAVCEWQVVWCCEKIRTGELNKMVGEKLTAGEIAKRFIDSTRNMPKSKEREELKAAAQEFSRLVEQRNGIVHGKPCTGQSGNARLSSQHVIEISDLECAADEFSACSIELNRLYYGRLTSNFVKNRVDSVRQMRSDSS